MSEGGVQAACEESEKRTSLYLFPGPAPPALPPRSSALVSSGSSAGPLSLGVGQWAKEGHEEVVAAGEDEDPTDSCKRRRPRPGLARTHARSASHGGVLATSSTGWQANVGSAPGTFSSPPGVSTITGRPSALKKPGHQRAFSQGQVVDIQGQQVTGHSRVGSRTDFILPPGHREEPRPPSSGKVPSFRGHSRQASRY